MRSPGAMLVTGTAILLGGGIAVVIGTRLEGLGIAGFVVPMIVYFFGIGITSPSATALAMAPVPQIAGTASAAVGVASMTARTLAGYETPRIGGNSPTTFAWVVVAMAGLASVLAWIVAIDQRRRRPHA